VILSHPTTKDELRAQFARSWTAFNAATARCPTALVEMPGPDGWSVKDQIAHVAAWERILIALLTGRSLGEAAGIEDAIFHASGNDEKNARLHAQHKDRSLAAVTTEAAATHAELLRVLANLSWEEINLPYSHYQATYLPTRDFPIWSWIRGMGYGHYEVHAEYVADTVAALKQLQAAS
jgi:hypothetical protein